MFWWRGVPSYCHGVWTVDSDLYVPGIVSGDCVIAEERERERRRERERERVIAVTCCGYC